MDDNITEKISQFLNDPQSMEQLKNLTSLLGNNSAEAPKPSAPPTAPTTPNPLGALGNMDVSPELLNTVMKIAPILSSVNKEDDSTTLLNALRPFLSEKRRSKLDESAKILSLLRILPLLRGSGLF